MPTERKGELAAKGLRFAIVVSRFNSFITERLLTGALDTLSRAGADDRRIEVVRVPGSFEIPVTAKALAQSGRFDAIITLGCIIRGETQHFDYISAEVTRGIQLAALETGVPMAFGVLTTHTLEQAVDRAGAKSGNKGAEVALAAIEMANLLRNTRRGKKR
ncbi:MAG TPA: 6,7-dimethyl-8-ribityllumazine synthase [Candidatus Xenobia bacterium]|nr:6,7-dimethyl-8-ribityllumazine synthase [Candidatus Xenobia bacterium]